MLNLARARNLLPLAVHLRPKCQQAVRAVSTLTARANAFGNVSVRCLANPPPRKNDQDEIFQSTGGRTVEKQSEGEKYQAKSQSKKDSVEEAEDEIFHSVGTMLNPEVSVEDLKAVEVAFDLIDEDSNGVICMSELTGLKTVLIDAGFEVEEVEQCLQEMDKNKNGEISKEEFAHWWFFNHHHERVLSIRDKVKQHYRGGEGKGDDRAD